VEEEGLNITDFLVESVFNRVKYR